MSCLGSICSFFDGFWILELKPSPILSRGAGDDGDEDAIEMALVGETHLQGDLGDGYVGGEQLSGAFDPQVEEVVVRCDAGGGFETAGEMGGTDPGMCGDPGDGEVLVPVAAHERPCALDP